MSMPEHYPDVLSETAMEHHKDILQRKGYINLMELPDGFGYVDFLQRFGDLVPQYDGQLIWSIKAEKRFEHVYHSLNNKPLTPHTECYEFESAPPKYLALWCIKAAECGGGQTTLADGYAFISSLTAEEQERLSSRRYEFFSTPGLQESQIRLAARHFVYDRYAFEGEPIVRFSSACMNDEGDPFMIDIKHRFVAFFDQTCEKISYKKNSLLLWDNWRMLHARTSFKDQTRHLKRVWLAKRPG